MSTQTVSEKYFEQLCRTKGITCDRLAEGESQTADYQIKIGSLSIIVEVKQLDINDWDKHYATICYDLNSPPAMAPTDRVKKMISEAYSQLKSTAQNNEPTMAVLYNNARIWNQIDTWTVTSAMFGSYGYVLGLSKSNTVVNVGQGYFGGRKVTRSTLRRLSTIGVMDTRAGGRISLECYHNPFSTIPVEPKTLSVLAEKQFIHDNPHERGFVPWEPDEIVP